MEIKTLEKRLLNLKTKLEKQTKRVEKLRIQCIRGPNDEWLKRDVITDVITTENEISTTLEKINLVEKSIKEESSKPVQIIPEVLSSLQEYLVSKWNDYDLTRRDELKNIYKELGYKRFWSKYTKTDYKLKDKTDDEIINKNIKDSKILITNLINRVKHITGEITDWSHISVTYDHEFTSALNGYVTGVNGKAKIESIICGGYNIQRLHIRVLVREFE